MPSSPTAALRLFFALWPDPALVQQLQQHQRLWSWSAPARPSAASKLHLTLLFMDGVDPAQVPQLLDIGARVAAICPAFTLQLDQLAVWPHGGIAHLAPGLVPPALKQLRQQLLLQATAAGMPCDQRPFHPHLTLARRALPAQMPAAFAPLPMHASHLVLAQSVLGQGRYLQLGGWQLGHSATPA